MYGQSSEITSEDGMDRRGTEVRSDHNKGKSKSMRKTKWSFYLEDK